MYFTIYPSLRQPFVFIVPIFRIRQKFYKPFRKVYTRLIEPYEEIG